MKSWLAVALFTAGLLVLFGPGTVARADDNDDDDRGSRADHTTFTSQSEDSFACACPLENICRVHATISNVGETDPEGSKVDIKFQDGDLVTIFVPAGTSHSLTQMMGTRDDKPVDDIVIFDPRDDDKDVNPIVAWVSIERLGGDGKKNGLFGCSTQPLP